MAKRFSLSPADIERLNPNTLTCPVFDSPRDSEIVLSIYKRLPVIWRDNPERNLWGLSFLRMFDMASDSDLFLTSEQLEQDGWTRAGNIFAKSGQRSLPLYEGKMVHQFDDRFGTYEGATQAQRNKGTLPRVTLEQHLNDEFVALPKYWVHEAEVNRRLAGRRNRDWLLGWRDICRSADERTVISTAIPRAAVGDKYLLIFPEMYAWLLQANLSAIVLDYCARQKFAGTSFKYYLFKQLPVLPPERYETGVQWAPESKLAEWVQQRVLELVYTSQEIRPYATEFGDLGEPFIWNEQRRFVIRAELDAAYFHLYEVDRDDVEHILESFRAFQNNDRERFLRTKDLIFEVYDAMADAARSGAEYQSVLDPPAGHGPRHRPRSTS